MRLQLDRRSKGVSLPSQAMTSLRPHCCLVLSSLRINQLFTCGSIRPLLRTRCRLTRDVPARGADWRRATTRGTLEKGPTNFDVSSTIQGKYTFFCAGVGRLRFGHLPNRFSADLCELKKEAFLLVRVCSPLLPSHAEEKRIPR